MDQRPNKRTKTKTLAVTSKLLGRQRLLVYRQDMGKQQNYQINLTSPKLKTTLESKENPQNWGVYLQMINLIIQFRNNQKLEYICPKTTYKSIRNNVWHHQVNQQHGPAAAHPL